MASAVWGGYGTLLGHAALLQEVYPWGWTLGLIAVTTSSSLSLLPECPLLTMPVSPPDAVVVRPPLGL